MSKCSVVVKRTQADENHEVVSVRSNKRDSGGYMKKPCPTCPWRKDAVGEFPAEAFRLSAITSYDMAEETFACHSTGLKSPKVCAGFLLRGADHNLAIRLALIKGEYNPDDTSDGGVELFDSYREMAIANGVPADDESLKLSRDD